MRILFLTHGFNSLTQRLYVELTALGHDISVEFDINDAVTVEAVEMFRPDLIIAPYLRRAIPREVWSQTVCLVVHPGIKGDRGPSSLDWAILDGAREWGVTVLQAVAGMDEGDVWSDVTFPMRSATKASLYRNEVTTAAAAAVLEAVERFASGRFTPEAQAQGTWRPFMKQAAPSTGRKTIRKQSSAKSARGTDSRVCSTLSPGVGASCSTPTRKGN